MKSQTEVTDKQARGLSRANAFSSSKLEKKYVHIFNIFSHDSLLDEVSRVATHPTLEFITLVLFSVWGDASRLPNFCMPFPPVYFNIFIQSIMRLHNGSSILICSHAERWSRSIKHLPIKSRWLLVIDGHGIGWGPECKCPY